MQLKLKCECGQVQGLLTIKSFSDGNNITCMCDDCQCFAHYLGKEDQILNKNGGTSIFQTTPNKMKITQGNDKLNCVALSPKGAKRWFTSCCRTPVGNTVSAKMSFIGLIHNFIDFNSIEESEREQFKNFSNHCMGNFGRGELPKNTSPKFPLGLTLKIMKTILHGKLFKTYQPNSLFNIETGAPVSPLQVIPKDEIAKIKGKFS